MMSEYLHHVGRRAELRQKKMSLKIAAGSHFESLRLALDPLVDLEDLEIEKIITLAAALTERVTDLREIQAQLEAIDRIIGQ